jgi:leader peptidase (prepilin peptidase)/N-methyltransferase
VVHPPSRCYACGTHVQWYDNLPLVSWLVLWGRCRWCGSPFSVRYLLLELLVAGITAAVLGWAFAAQNAPAPWLLAAGVGEPVARALAGSAALALAYFLLVAALIDLDHMIIPDELTKAFQLAAPFLAVLVGTNLMHLDLLDPGAWLARYDVYGNRTLTPLPFAWAMGGAVVGSMALLLASLPLARRIYGQLLPEAQRWSDADHRGFRWGVLVFCAALALSGGALAAVVALRPGTWWVPLAVEGALAVLGSLAGWMSLYLVGLVGTVVFRRNAMGFGDVKFLAPIGAFLGPVGVLYAFFVADIIGTVLGLPMRLLASRREIPFGPYLALGAVVVMFAGAGLHRLLFSVLLAPR